MGHFVAGNLHAFFDMPRATAEQTNPKKHWKRWISGAYE